MGHKAQFCFNPWRCKACFNYGHKAHFCLTTARPKIYWAPKRLSKSLSQEPVDHAVEPSSLDPCANCSEDPHTPSDASPSPNYSANRSPSPSPLQTSPHSPPSPMANFPCNPAIFVPQGLHVEHGSGFTKLVGTGPV